MANGLIFQQVNLVTKNYNFKINKLGKEIIGRNKTIA